MKTLYKTTVRKFTTKEYKKLLNKEMGEGGFESCCYDKLNDGGRPTHFYDGVKRFLGEEIPSCLLGVRYSDGSYWKYGLNQDGPVFDEEDLIDQIASSF
jgi:hypothetical protein